MHFAVARRSMLVAALVAPLAARGQMLPPTPMFPANAMTTRQRRQYGDQLRAMDEPALWEHPVGADIVQNDRLLVVPALSPAMAIRVDRNGAGEGRVIASRLTGVGDMPGKLGQHRIRPVATAVLARLDAALDVNSVWKRPSRQAPPPPPSSSSSSTFSPPPLPKVGPQFVFERVTKAGYQIMDAQDVELDPLWRRVVDEWLAVGNVSDSSTGFNLLP